MGISDALFSKSRQRVLGLFFGQPDRQFGTVEVISLVGSGSGVVQRELAKLSSNGLITAAKLGQQRRYQANHESPIFEDCAR